MPERPAVAVRVPDLAAHVAFFVDRLGFPLVEHRPAEDVALVRTERAILLLAGPGAGDLAGYFDGGQPTVLTPESLFFVAADLDARRADLAARGFVDAPDQLAHRPSTPRGGVPAVAISRAGGWEVAPGVGLREETTSWGERRLLVPGPAAPVVFVQPADHTPEEWLRLYASAPDALEAAVAGLAEPELDLVGAPGAWSIRHVVHHVADGDDLWSLPLKVALATPGRTCALGFHLGMVDNEEWAAGLAYAGRPIGPSLALFRANRAHFAELIRHLPDPWARHVMLQRLDGQAPTRLTVAELLATQARHALGHADEVRRTRQRHGR